MKHISDYVDHFVSWYYTRRLWGERCSAYEPTCPLCEKWNEHDWLFMSEEDFEKKYGVDE